MPKSFRLSKEELEYIEQVELFNRAGIKVCVLQAMDPDHCEGEVVTVAKRIERGPLEGKMLQMNVCEGHQAPEPGWEVIYD